MTARLRLNRNLYGYYTGKQKPGTVIYDGQFRIVVENSAGYPTLGYISNAIANDLVEALKVASSPYSRLKGVADYECRSLLHDIYIGYNDRCEITDFSVTGQTDAILRTKRMNAAAKKAAANKVDPKLYETIPNYGLF